MGERLRAVNETRGTVLCRRLEPARGIFEQSRGLLGRGQLEPGTGMLFQSGPLAPFMWMHMFFMRFAIDIVFLDRNNRVAKINRNLRPWRVSSLVFGARTALELEAGAAARSDTVQGDQIRFEAQ
jgi:uncharacterized protein